MIDNRRVYTLNQYPLKKGNILYWMSRDQRVNDSWSLLFAQELAESNKSTLIVAFCLDDELFGINKHQLKFIVEGIQQLKMDFNNLNIPFILFASSASNILPAFIKENNISALVCDFNPLRYKQIQNAELKSKLKIAMYDVDNHNIVPTLFVSNKLEYGAYTLRPKIKRVLDEFLTEYPKIKKQKNSNSIIHDESDFDKILADISTDKILLQSGENAAVKRMKDFINKKLCCYAIDKNDPNKDAVSGLSPYLHFGQIAAQRIAIEIIKSDISDENKNAFLEELIVRKELSDNFCFYNLNYDNTKGFPAWSIKSHEAHKMDERTYVYSLNEFEAATTHEKLWNAAQMQLKTHGYIHGYMRMYWAKKILEWSNSIEEAIKTAIYLNDTYALDGNDPNGYVGCMWSIGGVHDRPWGDRAIFGNVRYMNENGCKRKFDSNKYILKMNCLSGYL